MHLKIRIPSTAITESYKKIESTTTFNVKKLTIKASKGLFMLDILRVSELVYIFPSKLPLKRGSNKKKKLVFFFFFLLNWLRATRNN